MMDAFLSLNKVYHYAKTHSVTSDSRIVKEGDIFVALRGEKYDGAVFIESAIAKGAKIIVADHLPKEAAFSPQIHFVVHPEPRIILSQLAAIHFPEQPENIVAVTGT